MRAYTYVEITQFLSVIRKNTLRTLGIKVFLIVNKFSRDCQY